MNHFLTLAVAAVCLSLVLAQDDHDDHPDTNKKTGDGYYGGPYGGRPRFGGPYGGSHGGRFGGSHGGGYGHGGYGHGGYGHGYGYYKNCPKLDDPENGNVRITGIYPGNRAFYYCDIGHNLVGKRIRVCQYDGTWSPDAPVCEPVDCGPPDEADENGSVAVGDTTFNNTATYTCNNGYLLDLTQGGKDVVICQANGEWSHTAPSCSPVDCGLPPREDDDGEVSFTETILNSEAVYTCRPGYELESGEDSETFTCLPSGMWSDDTAPNCVPISCGPPPAPNANGAVTDGPNTYRSFATYSCANGYLLDTSSGGEEVINCQANGAWSGVPPNCVRIDCGIVLSPKNGVVNVDPDSQLGSEAQYSCIRGFDLIGAAVRVCQEDGEWSLSAPTCQKIVCPQLEAPESGKVTVSGNCVDDVAKYRCSKGHVLVGDKSRVCQEDGTWTGSDPTCKKVYYRPYGYRGASYKNDHGDGY